MIGEGPIRPIMPFDVAVALGRAPGFRRFNKFGSNEDVDSGTEDVWTNGGVRSLPTAAGAITATSTAAADDEGSTGAEIITVEYLDENYAEQSTTITLNGTANVVSSVSDVWRINRAFVSQAGSGRVNAGNITLTVDSNVQAHITAGLGQTQQCIGTVPAGVKFVVTETVLDVGRTGAADATFDVQVREFGTTTSWRTIDRVNLYESPSTNPAVLILPAKAEYRVQLETSGTNIFCTANLIGYYVDTSEFAT